MKITFLGTKGEIEESKWNHSKHASILVEKGNKRYVFDWGESFTRRDFERVKPHVLFLTHAHKDHAGGLAKLKEEHLKDLTIVCTKACKQGCEQVEDSYSLDETYKVPSVYKWVRYERILKKPVTVEGLTVIPFPVWHSVKALTNCYIIKLGKFKIAYCPDVLYINPPERGLLKDVDLYIGDGSSLDKDLVRKPPKGYKPEHIRIGHASIKTQLKWLQDAGVKYAIFTHLGEWAMNLPERELRSKVLELGKKYEVKAWVAQDGTTIEFSDKEFKVHLSVAIPGIYLVPPHGELIWKGDKTLIVKSRRFTEYLKQPLYLFSGNKAYGIIMLTRVVGPYDADHVRTRFRNRHKITDEEWEKWWPNVKEVYLYEFDLLKKFNPPVEVKLPPGIQTFVTAATVKDIEGLPEPEVTPPPSVKQEFDIETFDVSSLTDEQLVHFWAKCAAWYNKALKGDIKFTVEQILKFAHKVGKEMISRGIHPSPNTKLYHALRKAGYKLELPPEVYEAIEKELAPVHSFRPTSEQWAIPAHLQEVLSYFKPFYLKRPFIYIVGSLAKGETHGDIDIVISYPKRVPERDLPLEFRLGRMLPPELSSRLQFLYGEYGGPFTNYVPLYDLLVIPCKYREVVRMEELRDFFDTHVALKGMPENRAKEALVSRAEDSIKLFRFFIPAKPTIGHEPAVPYSLEELSKVVNKFPVFVEKKYDGNRLIIHKDGKKIQVFTENGFDVTSRLPGLVKEIQSWEHPDKVILDTDTERWTAGGEYIGREEVAAYLRSKQKADDTGIVANVFDVLYFFDSELKKHDVNCQIGDLHNEPLHVRRKYLELLPIKQSVTGAPDIKSHFNISPAFKAQNTKEMIKYVKVMSKAKASEGAVIKYVDSKYPLTGKCYEWWKFKKSATIHAIILKKLPTKTKGVYRYRVGVSIPAGWKPIRTAIVNGKEYMDIGKVMNIKKNIPVGTIVEVNFEELFYYVEPKTNRKQLVVYVAQISGIREDQTEPDSASEAVAIAEAAGVLRPKKELTTLSRSFLSTLMDDEPRKFVLQIHWRGRGAHGDLRWERTPGSKILDGMTLALMKKGVAKEDVKTLSQAKRLSVWKNMKIKPDPAPLRVFAAEKAPEPREWLFIEGVVPPGEVGATKYEHGVFYIFDKGFLHLGAQLPYFKEFFMYGDKLKGRWIFRLIPRRKPSTAKQAFLWLFGKPKDQMPYVLSKRAVKKGWVPPPGVSCLPPEMRLKIPKELRFWLEKDRKKRIEVRDKLVEAIKKGKVKLEEKIENVPFVVQHHWWIKRPLIRTGPTAQHWDLRIEVAKDKLIHFVLNRDPTTFSSGIVGYEKPCNDSSWMKKGDGKPESIPPGQPGNPTKDTPSYILIIDKGKCSVITRTPTFIRIQFHSGKMKGLWIGKREDPSSDIWVFERSELPSPS